MLVMDVKFFSFGGSAIIGERINHRMCSSRVEFQNLGGVKQGL